MESSFAVSSAVISAPPQVSTSTPVQRAGNKGSDGESDRWRGDRNSVLRAAVFRLFGRRSESPRARVDKHVALAEVVDVEHFRRDDGAPPVPLAPCRIDAHMNGIHSHKCY